MAQFDRRSSPRAETRQRVRLRDAFQLVPGAVLIDLSVTGCQIALKGAWLELNQIVVVRPDGLEGLSGVVRWLEEDRAGIEFDRPLHPGVAAHIAAAVPDISGAGAAVPRRPAGYYGRMQLLKSVA
ncbi:MAG TPA: PilZ domain-containing protein [Sphingomonadaceae bacterium]|nr:PilZ domain-containing protein [Sphingomonadaceae bacterium]